MMSDEIKNEGVEIPIEDGTEEASAEADMDAAEASAEAEADAAEADADAEEASAEADADAEEASAEADADAAEASAETTDDMQSKYVRLMAEFQNYKKRTAKEKEDIYSYGAEKVMLSLLEVLDNFERALEQGCSDEKHAEGMKLIFTQLMTALKKNGLEEIEALGEDFNPNFHSAVLMEDSDEYESGKVCFVVQKGYTLNGKVIRPAMVKVAN